MAAFGGRTHLCASLEKVAHGPGTIAHTGNLRQGLAAHVFDLDVDEGLPEAFDLLSVAVVGGSKDGL